MKNTILTDKDRSFKMQFNNKDEAKKYIEDNLIRFSVLKFIIIEDKNWDEIVSISHLRHSISCEITKKAQNDWILLYDLKYS